MSFFFAYLLRSHPLFFSCTPPPKDPMPASVEISSNCTPFSSSEITDPKRSIQGYFAKYLSKDRIIFFFYWSY